MPSQFISIQTPGSGYYERFPYLGRIQRQDLRHIEILHFGAEEIVVLVNRSLGRLPYCDEVKEGSGSFFHLGRWSSFVGWSGSIVSGSLSFTPIRWLFPPPSSPPSRIVERFASEQLFSSDWADVPSSVKYRIDLSYKGKRTIVQEAPAWSGKEGETGPS